MVLEIKELNANTVLTIHMLLQYQSSILLLFLTPICYCLEYRRTTQEEQMIPEANTVAYKDATF